MTIENDSLRYMLSLVESTRNDAIDGYIDLLEKNSCGQEIDLNESSRYTFTDRADRHLVKENWKVRLVKDTVTNQTFAIKIKKFLLDQMHLKPFQCGGTRLSRQAFTEYSKFKRHVVMESYIFNVLGKHHPHIARVFQTLINVNTHELVMKMDHYSGSVADISRKFGRLKPHTIRKLVHQMLMALSHCHSILVIHCDIKPENIFVSVCDQAAQAPDIYVNEGVVGKYFVFKLGDFDMAKLLLPPPHPDFVVGPDYNVNSIGYKPPEIICGGNYGYPVDMWALGVSIIVLHCDKRMNSFFAMDERVEIQDQLYKQSIYCGSLYPDELSDGSNPYNLLPCENIYSEDGQAQAIERCFGNGIINEHLLWLLHGLLIAKPSKRITAKAAMLDPYFYINEESL